MLKIAIIGAGFIGKIHAASFKAIREASVTAIVDSSEEAGRKLAQNINADYFSDLDDLLEKRDVDGIIVATPQFLHYTMVKKIAECGIPVLCEKPIAISLEEADAMVDLVERKKIIAMTGHVIRFFPEYVLAKQKVESGELGTPLLCYSERLSSPPDWAKWRFDENCSGGVTLDLHIHDLDFLTWLFGNPASIRSKAIFNPEHGGIAHISSVVEFKNNICGLAQGGWDFPDSFPFTTGFKILCKEGALEWGFRAGKNIEPMDKKPDFLEYLPDGKVITHDLDNTDSFTLENRYFISCIKNNKQAEIATFMDGRNILELALSAMRSAKEHKTIDF